MPTQPPSSDLRHRVAELYGDVAYAKGYAVALACLKPLGCTALRDLPDSKLLRLYDRLVDALERD